MKYSNIVANFKRNIFGYLQAAISFLIILCTFFPYIENFLTTKSGCKTSAIASFTAFFTSGMYTIDKGMFIGILFVVFILSQVINIFVQVKKNIGLVAIVTSLFGLIPIILLNNHIGNLGGSFHFKYQFGFYCIVVLLALQMFVQLGALFALLDNQSKEAYAIPSDEPDESPRQTKSVEPVEPVETVKSVESVEPTETIETIEPADPAHSDKHDVPATPEQEVEQEQEPQLVEPTSDSELESLRAEAEALRAEHERIKAEEEKARLEKERLERERLEKERQEEELRRQKARAEQLERERIEKENLKKEIEELKKLLQKQKENLESNQ